MGTIKKRIERPADIQDPNVVKVVTDAQSNALYFSRSPIPFPREEHTVYFKHIGLYVYRRDFLLTLAALPPTPLEEAEVLEQLRALEHGYRIVAIETSFDSIGVDTPDDLDRVRALVERERAAAPAR